MSTCRSSSTEGLRWLGQARVPVVLLSATLSAGQRQELIGAYLAGAASREEFRADPVEPGGYPSVASAWLDTSGVAACGEVVPRTPVDQCTSWRSGFPVNVAVLPEAIPTEQERRAGPGEKDDVSPGDAAVVGLLADRLREGGRALVIRNTVPRAQSLYRALRQRFPAPGEVRLLHGRFSAQQRADLTQEALDRLAPPPGKGPDRERPGRFILVATQIAEQSFDVDADVLVSDLAPVDLLLQRIGRLHRHEGFRRPSAVKDPWVVLTGFDVWEGSPRFPFAAEKIYSRFLLLRSLALVQPPEAEAEIESVPGADASPGAGAGGEPAPQPTPRHAVTWTLPEQVPTLVGSVYDKPVALSGTVWAEAEAKAQREWQADQRERASKAADMLLTRLGEHERRTLAGLHSGAVGTGRGTSPEAVVRDGEMGVEVILVVRDGERFATLAGRPLTENGDVAEELLDGVLGGTVRLPAKFDAVATKELGPLPGWIGHSWLRYSRALVLDECRTVVLGDTVLRYDDELGLVEV